MIRKSNGKFFVLSKEGRKLSKGFKTKEEADKRLREIEFFVNRKIK